MEEQTAQDVQSVLKKPCFCPRGSRRCEKRIKNGHCDDQQCAMIAMSRIVPQQFDLR